MKNLALKRVTCILLSIISVICYAVVSGVRVYDETLLEAERLTKALLRQDNSKQNIDMTNAISATYIKDAEEEEAFVLASGSNSGYAIFSKDDLQLIEYSPYGNSPYSEIDTDKAIYAGVGNYLEKKGKDVKNIHTQKKYNKEELKEIKKGVKNKVDKIKDKNKKSKVTLTSNNLTSVEQDLDDLVRPGESTVISTTLIPDYEYFLSDLQYHNNSEGSCTTVAGQILLAYNNWANDGRLITNPDFLYSNPNSEDNLENCENLYTPEHTSTSEAFFYYLYSLTGEGANFLELSSSIDNYLDNYVAEEARNNITKGWFIINDLSTYTIRTNIDNGYPCIAGIEYMDTENGEEVKAYHAIVVYGYQNIVLDDSSKNGFIANFGWIENKTCDYVWFDEGWVNSCFYLYSTHTHSDSLYNGSAHIYKCDTCDRLKADENHFYENSIQILPTDKFAYKCQDYHYSFCSCGYKKFDSHDFKIYKLNYKYGDETNGQIDGIYHKTICWDCGYTILEQHYIKYNSCYYCGYY